MNDNEIVIGAGGNSVKNSGVTLADIVTASQLESQSVLTTSQTIDPDVRSQYVDPSAGDITLTLPDSTDPDVGGSTIMFKRVENGGNIVDVVPLGGDNINGYTSSIRMANMNEYTKLQAVNGYGWQEINRHMTAYASMALVTPTTFNVTTGFTKFTGFDLDTFSTAQKFTANEANSTLDIAHHTGAAFDAYHVDVHITFEGNQNKFVEIQIYDQAGNPMSPLVSVNGLGSGKPVTAALSNNIIAALSVNSLEVRMLCESAQTLDIIAASFEANRIGG